MTRPRAPIVALTARGLLAALALAALAGPATLPAWPAPAADLGFSEGLAPLDVGAEPPSSADCGRCHEDEHRAWLGSRHRAAHTNPLYQAGLVAEPSPFCVNCHSPLRDQAAEVVANLGWYRAQDPRREAGDEAERHPEPRASEGVGCAACHWRDGVVLAANEVPWAPHRTRVAPELTDGTLCRGCHEFRMPAMEGEALRLTDVPMQATWTEWTRWRESGGAQTCADCHAPGGDHAFAGAHDRELLRDAVAVEAAREGEEVRFVLESVGVGHHLPTGDLFRALVLQVDHGGGFVDVHRVGRTFAVRADPETGEIAKVPDADTSLRPGEPVDVRVAAPGPLRWRLRFHYGAPHDEARGLIPREDLVITLHVGRVD